MYDELEKIGKEAIAAYFQILTWYSSGMAEENQHKSQVSK
jgi:hypothetical protein